MGGADEKSVACNGRHSLDVAWQQIASQEVHRLQKQQNLRPAPVPASRPTKLPQALEATIIQRQVGTGFRVGLASMNGWRRNNEDAHIVHIGQDFGFFGVFDGHGGPGCSEFVAQRIGAQLGSQGCPADAAALKKLMLDTDAEFLRTMPHDPSGSTGTMCIVDAPQGAGDSLVHVANIGDSRVLLARRDGTLVDGGGTDGALTTDHKPNDDVEQERIERCGGFVLGRRVNGALAITVFTIII